MSRVSGTAGRKLGILADVVVVSENHARERGTVQGTVIHEALTPGTSLVDAA